MWDRYRALMSAVMMQAIIDYKTYCKSPNPPREYWSAVGYILNDENWQLLDIDMTGEDAMKVINKKTLQEIKSSWGYVDEAIDCKPIIAIELKTGKITHYSNTRNAFSSLRSYHNINIHMSGIRECLRGHQKSTRGYAFKFDEGGEDDELVASIQAPKKRARKNA